MGPRSELKKIIKKAKRDLTKHNELDSPMFYIKSKHPGSTKIAYRPIVEDPNQSFEDIGLKLNEICNRVDAKEVITFAQIIIRETDKNPEIPVLVARLEKADKVFIMYQPYIYYEADNKFQFKKETWKTIDKEDSTGIFEHQVPGY